MGIGLLTERSAVERALEQFDLLGRDEFLSHYNFGQARDYFVAQNHRLYDAKAIAGVAFGYQHPDRGPLIHNDFNGGVTAANAALAKLGYTIIRGRPDTVADEKMWRLALWEHLRSTTDTMHLAPRVLRSYGIYGGAQGIWVDASRTQTLDAGHSSGVTMGLLHTGIHYPDELSSNGLIYHYPATNRPPSRDASEVAATKAAAELGLPIFVITKPTPSSDMRTIHLAWIEGWNDANATFLITYGRGAPDELLTEDRSDDRPFHLEGNRSRRVRRSIKDRPDQQRFKFEVLHRYGSGCPLSGISVPEMIEAAHLRGDADGGSSDPRNGLPLNAGLHRAFDAHLFAIDPDTLDVVVRPYGPTAAEMGITVPHIRGLTKRPHVDALRWRYDEWLRRTSAGG